MIRILLGLAVFALATLTGNSAVDAQCGYSYHSPTYQYSTYTPVQYSNSYYAPSCNYGNSYYAPSSAYRSNYSGWNYNNTRSQRVRNIAAAAIVVGAVIAISNSGDSRNRNRRRH